TDALGRIYQLIHAPNHNRKLAKFDGRDNTRYLLWFLYSRCGQPRGGRHMTAAMRIATAVPPGVDRPARLTRVEGLSRVDSVYVTTRDGVRLAVRDSGSRYARHTVVFLHGLCLNQATWVSEFDHLLRRYA